MRTYKVSGILNDELFLETSVPLFSETAVLQGRIYSPGGKGSLPDGSLAVKKNWTAT
jgi:hypothetical protein